MDIILASTDRLTLGVIVLLFLYSLYSLQTAILLLVLLLLSMSGRSPSCVRNVIVPNASIWRLSLENIKSTLSLKLSSPIFFPALHIWNEPSRHEVVPVFFRAPYISYHLTETISNCYFQIHLHFHLEYHLHLPHRQPRRPGPILIVFIAVFGNY